MRAGQIGTIVHIAFLAGSNLVRISVKRVNTGARRWVGIPSTRQALPAVEKARIDRAHSACKSISAPAIG